MDPIPPQSLEQEYRFIVCFLLRSGFPVSSKVFKFSFTHRTPFRLSGIIALKISYDVLVVQWLSMLKLGAGFRVQIPVEDIECVCFFTHITFEICTNSPFSPHQNGLISRNPQSLDGQKSGGKKRRRGIQTCYKRNCSLTQPNGK